MNVQNKARELIEAGQKEVVLDDQRLEQNRARVLARAAVIGAVAAGVSATSSLGAASSAGAAGKAAMGAAAATKAAATFSIAKLAVAVVVVGGSVTGSYALATHKTEPRVEQAVKATPPARTSVAHAVPVPAAPQVETESKLAPTEGEPLAPPKSDGAASKPQASAKNLSEHADMLREARAALTAGNAAKALALLDGHREVARGPLGPEWAAARILVLCRLGRVAEAKQQGARFLKSHASSPLAAQVAASCAGE